VSLSLPLSSEVSSACVLVIQKSPVKAAVPSERRAAAGLAAVPSPIRLILPSRSMVSLSLPLVSRSITNLLLVVVS
jgi:hypothetical protein